MKLEQAIRIAEEDERFLLGKMNDQDKQEAFVLSLKSTNEIKFLYQLFVNKNIISAKKSLNNIASVNSFYSEKFKRDIFEALNTFCFPILSDNSKLIGRYLTYKPIEYFDAFSTFFGQAIQGLLKGDDALLEASIAGMKKYAEGDGWEKNFQGLPMAFQGFRDQEKDLIEEGISLLLRKHASQGAAPITKAFINYEAATLAKLCRIKGLELQVRSPLIPDALIANEELDAYPTYKFMGDMFQ